MEEGWVGCIAIVVGVGLALALIYLALLAIGYALAFLGMTVIIPLDFTASAFTWLGAKDPATAWLFLGFFTGAAIGLVKGLKAAGRSSDLWKIYLGAGVFALLLLLGAYLAQPLPAVTASVSSPLTPGPSNYISSLNARITEMKFFEGGNPAPPKERRTYSTRFAKNRGQQIYWEINLTHPRSGARKNFTMNVTLTAPDGKTSHSQSSSYLAPDWENSLHGGWLCAAQSLAPGTYKADFFVDGVKVASSSFSVS